MQPQFVCPITHEVMADPVTDRDGNTFERAAIEAWLSQHGSSPMTRLPMRVEDLVPNRALRDAINAAVLVPPPPSAATCPPPEEVFTAGLKVEFLSDNIRGESLIRVVPPSAPHGNRPAVDVCCVLDISGSMDDRATIKNEAGDREHHGLNLLDVVKHATRAVAAMLNDDDRIAIVLFTTDARVLLPLTSATAINRKRLYEELETVNPENSTNLWGGLELAMNMMRDRTAAEAQLRSGHVLLLTDGQPNVEPPRGHLPTLDRYIEALPGAVASFTVHTFGFGYSIDTPLLRAIAERMGGLYVFIPDSGLVGTVFVNTASNILCTAATGLSIAMELTSGRTIALHASDPSLVASQQDVAPSVVHATLGSIQFGQPRTILVKWAPKDEDAKHSNDSEPGIVRVSFSSNGVRASVSVTEQTIAGNVRDAMALAEDRCRCDFLHLLKRMCSQGESPVADAAAMIKATKDHMAPYADGSKLVAAIVKDLDGEVLSAVSDRGVWVKWGQHYIPSLLRANAVQQCNNFKDNSVQCYGSAFFDGVRDAGEKAFLSVPAPVPRAAMNNNRYGGTAAATQAAPNMRNYYNCSGGCITPDSLVLLPNGNAVAACEVTAGTVLRNGARVTCVVRIPFVSSSAPLVRLNPYLCITEYHPVRLQGGGDWVFPVDCPHGQRLVDPSVQMVYTYLLENGVAVPCYDGIEVVALGHGLTDNDVVKHAYLGTQRVVDDLKRLTGFDAGMVTVGSFVRNSSSNCVVGICPALRPQLPQVVVN